MHRIYRNKNGRVANCGRGDSADGGFYVPMP